MKTLIGPTSAADPSIQTRTESFSWVGKMAGVITFVGLMVVASQPQMRILLPDNPIPVTLQSLVAVMAGATLGGRLGTLALAVYLGLGAVLDGVFSLGLWSATGGYIIGFLVAQPVVGMLTHIVSEQPRDSICRLFLAGVVGHAVIFACGVAGLMAWTSGSLVRAFEIGVLPFVVGSFLKIALLMIVGAPVHAALRTRFDPAR